MRIRMTIVAATVAAFFVAGLAYAQTGSTPPETTTGADDPQVQQRWQKNNCQRPVPRREFRKKARRILKHHSPITRRESRKIRRLIKCARTNRDARKMNRYRKKLHRYRKRHKWDFRFYRMSRADQGWAIRTSTCESGRNPRTNTGNGYLGAFQFLLSTAYAAGFKQPPNVTSLHEQDVRSVRWRNIAGAGQWPVCGS